MRCGRVKGIPKLEQAQMRGGYGICRMEVSKTVRTGAVWRNPLPRHHHPSSPPRGVRFHHLLRIRWSVRLLLGANLDVVSSEVRWGACRSALYLQWGSLRIRRLPPALGAWWEVALWALWFELSSTLWDGGCVCGRVGHRFTSRRSEVGADLVRSR